jgi:hypothetical protein
MKINTNTLLIAGAAVVGVYLLTRPKTPTYPVGYNPYQTGYPAGTYPAIQQGNPTAQIISAGGSALSSLSDLIGNFF